MFDGTRLLSRDDVTTLLSLTDCIPAVEEAFRAHALGRTLPSGVIGIHTSGGGFHIKAAGLADSVFATKVNGNFAGNPERFGLPRIQGLIVLCDSSCGYPLAVMDSTEITVLRTAAATAVAARRLASPEARVVAVAGCGRQAPAQLEAVATVRSLDRVYAFDTDPSRSLAFARAMTARLGVPVETVSDLPAATRLADIVVTCTSAQRVVLGIGDVKPGAFVAAVGADSDTKQEISAELMAASAVVPDLLEQAATIGDLHHAIAAGLMTRQSVRAELGAILAGQSPGRCHDSEVVIFDSTGAALQDVAAARVVFERAVERRRGVVMDLLGNSAAPARRAPRPLSHLEPRARL